MNPAAVSDYEILRVTNIERNNAFLKSIGICVDKITTGDSEVQPTLLSKKKRKFEIEPVAPTRQSVRIAALSTSQTHVIECVALTSHGNELVADDFRRCE